MANKMWAFIIYAALFVRVRTEYHTAFDKEKPYIFCANHTSMLDIPIMGLTAPHYFKFMGKASLAKVPLFGFIYNRLNILVERSSKLSSYKAFQKAKDALKEGISVVIFPEGGINREQIPGLARFKDGAFRMAIETGAPIVPVTILNNWKVMHAYNIDFHWYPTKVIYHAPIPTSGLTLDDAEALKLKVKETILNEIDASERSVSSYSPNIASK